MTTNDWTTLVVPGAINCRLTLSACADHASVTCDPCAACVTFDVKEVIIGTFGVLVAVGVGVRVKVAVALGVKVSVKVAVTVGVAVRVGVEVSVLVGVNVGVNVSVGVGVKVGVNVALGVNVGVMVGVSVTVADGTIASVGSGSSSVFPQAAIIKITIQ